MQLFFKTESLLFIERQSKAQRDGSHQKKMVVVLIISAQQY
jgi:hypothetical protein